MKRLAHCERETTAELIAHLMEFDTRKLHLAADFPSFFSYCCEVLRLSEHEAYNRIEVARTARTFPAVLDLLRSGALTQTTARLLAPHLDTHDCADLLAAACGRSKRQVEELIARRRPRPDVSPSIRKVPVRREPQATSHREAPSPVRSAEPAPARPPLVAPLAPERYEFRFTGSRNVRDLLSLARICSAARSRRRPGGRRRAGPHAPGR